MARACQTLTLAKLQAPATTVNALRERLGRAIDPTRGSMLFGGLQRLGFCSSDMDASSRIARSTSLARSAVRKAARVLKKDER